MEREKERERTEREGERESPGFPLLHPCPLIYEFTLHYCLLLIAIKLYHSSMRDDILAQVDILLPPVPPSVNPNSITAHEFEWKYGGGGGEGGARGRDKNPCG